MKTRIFFLPLLMVSAAAGLAQNSGRPPEPPPPVVLGATPADTPALAHNQKLYGPTAAQEMLVPPEVVNGIIEKFRSAYGAPSAPRIIIYVNRDLVDTTAGLQLTGHTENYEKTNDTMKTSGQNMYKSVDAAPPTLADKQTVRDIERLFGRVFRNAGAKLADQKSAVDLLADKADQRLIGDTAAKQRQALAAIADVAVEVLISSKNQTLVRVSGDQVVSVPDIQATAIRLKDSTILGQATAADVLGKGQQADQIARTFGAPEIIEATALSLMQDMLTGAK
jgi:hypothetical protein